MANIISAVPLVIYGFTILYGLVLYSLSMRISYS